MLLKQQSLGMRASEGAVMGFGDHPAVSIDSDAAHHRIGFDMSMSPQTPPRCAVHEGDVECRG